MIITPLVLPSVTLLIMGLCLWVSLRLLYGARGPTPDDDVHLLIRILSRSLVLVSVIGLLVSSSMWISIVLIAIVAEAALEMVLARRAAQRHSVWRAIAAAVAGRPTPMRTLRLHQSRFTGVVGRRFRRLLADLESGMDYNAAIAANHRALPRLAPTYFAVLSPTAFAEDPTELHAAHDAPYRQLWHDTIQRCVYLLTLLLILATVLAFSAINLIPSYQEIFADFDRQLPPFSRGMIAILYAFATTVGLPLGFLGLVLILAGVFVAFAYLCDWPVLQPVADRLGFSRHRAHIMRLLAASFASDVPLNDAIARLQGGWAAYPSRLARNRLAAAGDSIAAGQPWTEALEDARLITPSDAATLRAAQVTGHLPWTLRMLADRTLQRFVLRWATIQHILFTAAILFFGLLVFLFVTAMFVPLVDLIQSLAI